MAAVASLSMSSNPSVGGSSLTASCWQTLATIREKNDDTWSWLRNSDTDKKRLSFMSQASLVQRHLHLVSVQFLGLY